MHICVAIQVNIIDFDLVRNSEIKLIMTVQRDQFSLFCRLFRLNDELIFSIKKLLLRTREIKCYPKVTVSHYNHQNNHHYNHYNHQN